ncbi:PaaI family thioesterase [Rhodopseudomonas palustris]|uniref:PaaI family thioesterase n=1 Tax=Rhodopseudomonas palustris TaxID=1076 RepID=UPI0001779898|nr:PaaI family thioesterase [Rhodopseudomonas palustris]ACF03502.1 thioesterase superfamily protein [Rhodopseudomonas palustris TIE-1]WBU29610.1 PaaI family thioesterase [Rhodopseudomonas palustris]
MTETTTARSMKADGWSVIHDDGFIDLVGPLWHRCIDGTNEYAIATAAKHRNKRGLVQGGLMMTLADRTSGIAARDQSGAPHLATVQMDTHFVDAAEIGEVLISRPRVVRTTRSLIFTSTEVSVDRRCIILAHGVFKIVRPR